MHTAAKAKTNRDVISGTVDVGVGEETDESDAVGEDAAVGAGGVCRCLRGRCSGRMRRRGQGNV